MHRIELESWLNRHPGSIHAPAQDLIDRCEVEVHKHAEVLAWKHALRVATASLRRFDGLFGLPASETFVTREVCHEVARELKRHEPRLGAVDENEWLSLAILDSLDEEARAVLCEWLRDHATQEEHRVWQQVVAYTHHVARALIEKGHLTRTLDWDLDRTYPKVAMRVARLLLREYAAHLRASRNGTAMLSALH